MLLTKLEIKGFKSFGDKVTINFDEGVTGIVGQNGCGKSNVVDAIRWVLGEQKTKALRSDKMESIIFNGTRKRKPLQMAEVSLTFKNTKNLLATEYSEVTITRRLYRTGESEYMLNNVSCRLKDITNLFLDTGIGSDSYAIIELKMVDEILNDKENSRRNLFEEAAGISKFKIRKKETLKKLDDASQDLARVEDLLFEIDKNLKALEKQAKKTERYYKTREEYKQASILLAQKSVSERGDTFLSLGKKIDAENDKKLQLNVQLTEKEAIVEKEKTEIIIKEQLLATRQKALNEYVGHIRNYESEKKIKNERLKFLNDRQVSLLDLIDQDNQRKNENVLEIQKLDNDVVTNIQILEEYKKDLAERKEEYEDQQQKTASIQAQTGILSAQFNKKQQENYELNKTYEIRQTQSSSAKQELEKAVSNAQQRAMNLSEYEDELFEVQEELQNTKDALERLNSEEIAIQEQIEQVLAEIEIIKTAQTVLNRSIDAKQNEYNLTKSLVDNLEGFSEAIKFLKKSGQDNPNNGGFDVKTPFLSDILSCEQQYRIAIENYLEPLMNYYVVDNQIDALNAIYLLSDAKKGKANFFILEDFKDFQPKKAENNNQNSNQKDSQNIPKNAVFALDIADFDAKYQNLMAHILEDVFIVESLPENLSENNQKDTNKENQNIFITQNGQISRRKYSVSGGSVGAFEGKRIGRAKNMELLEKEIISLKEAFQEKNNHLQNKQIELQELRQNTKKQQIREVQQDFAKINERFISVRTRQEQMQSLITTNQTQKEDLERKLADLLEEIDELSPQIKIAKTELDTLKTEIDAIKETQDFETEALAQKSGAFNQQNVRYLQQQSRLDAIKQEISFKQANLDTVQARLDKNQQEITRIKEDIEALNNASDEGDDTLISMYEQKTDMEKGVNEAEKDYYKTRSDIDIFEKEAKEIQRNRELTDSLLSELQNKFNDTKLSLAAIKERLSVEFNVELEDVMQAASGIKIIQTEVELNLEMQKLKGYLDNIGAINPMAMEAYNEIKERNDFITAQRDDLLKAKNVLLETILEIDTIAKGNFMTTFVQIRENFQKVFRSLFTEEDTCDLILVNPDNPLESAIDIVAKPKGKRPLSINQLSGGEKTLTATSLLFAIYLIKPAPFCIFDEVDAPLDDANVDKFNNIIRKFSAESQFIIVTHNKRTMASTDIMYGVTMYPEDPGVSKLVPVDLRGLAEIVG